MPDNANSINNQQQQQQQSQQEFLQLLGPAYARHWQYFKALLFSSILQGIVLGFVALAFFNFYTILLDKTWNTGAYEAALSPDNNAGSNSLEPLLLGNGEWWYFFMLTGAGLGVGLIKCVWSSLLPKHTFPDKIKGFLEEISELHSDDPLLIIAILAASGVSIGLGGSVGCEAALGATGVAVGSVVGRRWRIGPHYQAAKHPSRNDRQTEQDVSADRDPNGTPSPKKSCLARFFEAVLPDFEHDLLCSVDGMAASFGAIFPSQFIAPMIIHEMGNHWGPGGNLAYTETIARSGIAATVAYAVFVSLKGDTILSVSQLPESFYDELLTFKLIWIAYGILMGFICGLVGFIGFLCLAVGSVLGRKVTERLNVLGNYCGLPEGHMGKLFTPVIGGLLVGPLTIAAPLILGDGQEQLSTIFIFPNELGVGTLICTAFLKLVALGICLGFGFVGGPCFPLILAGACTGSVIHLLIPDIPLLLAYPCCFVGVPTAILPGFFSFTALSANVFVLGGPATTVVFLTCVVSFTVVSGLGLAQSLILKAMRKQEMRASGEENDGDESASWNPLLHKAFVARRPREVLTALVPSHTLPVQLGSTASVPAVDAVTSSTRDDEALHFPVKNEP